MSYLYNIHIVVEDDVENVHTQSTIDELVEKAIAKELDVNIVGSSICELDEKNSGRCCKCGTWCSDQEKEPHIDNFSDGCVINGKWWCDLCLPPNHPKRF